jgi:hypothetical protein
LSVDQCLSDSGCSAYTSYVKEGQAFCEEELNLIVMEAQPFGWHQISRLKEVQ